METSGITPHVHTPQSVGLSICMTYDINCVLQLTTVKMSPYSPSLPTGMNFSDRLSLSHRSGLGPGHVPV